MKTTKAQRAAELENERHVRIPGPEAICLCLNAWPCLTSRLIDDVDDATAKLARFQAARAALEKSAKESDSLDAALSAWSVAFLKEPSDG